MEYTKNILYIFYITFYFQPLMHFYFLPPFYLFVQTQTPKDSQSRYMIEFEIYGKSHDKVIRSIFVRCRTVGYWNPPVRSERATTRTLRIYMCRAPTARTAYLNKIGIFHIESAFVDLNSSCAVSLEIRSYIVVYIHCSASVTLSRLLCFT